MQGVCPWHLVGVNVICPPVMYTNKVLSGRHMVTLAQAWAVAIEGLEGKLSVDLVQSRGDRWSAGGQPQGNG